MGVFHYARLGQVRLPCLRSAIGPYYPQAIRSLRSAIGPYYPQAIQSLRSAIGPYYPQAIRSIDQDRFQNILCVLYYVRLGQVRLRRALQSAIGPYYPQAIRFLDQARFQNILLLLHYVRLGWVRLRRSNDPHSVLTFLRFSVNRSFLGVRFSQQDSPVS